MQRRATTLRTLLPLGAAALIAAAPVVSDDLAAQSYAEAIAVGDGQVFVGEPEAVGRPGTVYVYARGDGGEWTETARLTGSDPSVGDGFGGALAYADGHLFVGAMDEDGGRGALYVLRAEAGSWSLVDRIQPAELGPQARFGAAVAAGGQLAVVGAPTDENGRGTAYLLRRDGSGGWSVAGTLVGADAQPDDAFGASVAFDGDRVLIGAPRKERGGGAAYLFGSDPEGEGWSQVAKLRPDDLERGFGFGASALLDGDRLLVGAPGFARATGAVYAYERDAEQDEWEVAAKLLPFDGPRFAQFGISLAALGEEVWVGAPRAAGLAGRIYRLARDPESRRWISATALEARTADRGDQFASLIAVAGEVAVVSATGADYGAGTAVILERGPQGWTEESEIWSEPAGIEAVTGGMVACNDGNAAAFACSAVDLLSFLPVGQMGAPRGVRTNDVWGWVDPETGREWALVGMTDQTAFVDVTDPENPVHAGRLPMTEGASGSTWRDIKVYEDHAFVVSDGAGEHGMQIFDLRRLRQVDGGPVTFEPDAVYDRIASAHNLVIDTETGFAYVVGASGGGETCGGGLHMVDIREATRPAFVGCFADRATGRQRTGYTHDAQCVIYRGPDERYRDREICLGANETALSIADVTDKENPVPVAVATYPNVGYAHQGWLTEDHRYFYMNDELDEIQGGVERTRTLVWDVRELDDPVLVKELLGTTRASDHNLYVKGSLIYQSHYQAGLRVLDITDPEDPREVAYLDTVPFGENEPGFGGSWSNYPYFPSGNVIVTSGRQGLFVVRVRPAEVAAGS